MYSASPLFSESLTLLPRCLPRNIVQLLQDVFAVCHPLVEVALDHLVDHFQEKLLRQHHVGAWILPETADSGGAHRGEALVGADGSRVGRGHAPGLAVELKDGRAGGPVKPEIINPLPVPGDDA